MKSRSSTTPMAAIERHSGRHHQRPSEIATRRPETRHRAISETAATVISILAWLTLRNLNFLISQNDLLVVSKGITERMRNYCVEKKKIISRSPLSARE